MTSGLTCWVRVYFFYVWELLLWIISVPVWNEMRRNVNVSLNDLLRLLLSVHPRDSVMNIMIEAEDRGQKFIVHVCVFVRGVMLCAQIVQDCSIILSECCECLFFSHCTHGTNLWNNAVTAYSVRLCYRFSSKPLRCIRFFESIRHLGIDWNISTAVGWIF